MFLLTTILDTVRKRLTEKPAVKIRGTDGKVTRIQVPPGFTPKQMLDVVRRHARLIRDHNCGARIHERPHSSIVVLDDGNYVTIWYGDNEHN